MNQLRVHTENPAVVKLIPRSGTLETHVQLGDGIGDCHLYAEAFTINGSQIPEHLVDVPETDFDQVESLVHRRRIEKKGFATPVECAIMGQLEYTAFLSD